ncbi:MAG: glycosyltransferase, partial [Proteobacteria bacterium]
PRPAPVPGRLLMVGLLEHAPNAVGLRRFVDEVLPSVRERVPGAELHAVGFHGVNFASTFGSAVDVPGLVLRGFVEDLAQEYARASVVIAPIFTGGGTQIKVIDALAHERPLVASPFAYGGFAADLKAPDHLRVARDPAEWIEHCVALLKDPAAAEALAARGHRAASVYDAGTMTITIQTMVRQVLGEQFPQVRQ